MNAEAGVRVIDAAVAAHKFAGDIALWASSTSRAPVPADWREVQAAAERTKTELADALAALAARGETESPPEGTKP